MKIKCSLDRIGTPKLWNTAPLCELYSIEDNQILQNKTYYIKGVITYRGYLEVLYKGFEGTSRIHWPSLAKHYEVSV